MFDVASVEIVHGPAPALYGANAFNGVLLTNSKDPFKDPGLTVRLRGGNRNLLDGQLRYATKIGERMAFKISGGATVADDFIADNKDATSSRIEPGNNPTGSNLGYDAVSRYGDVGNTYDAAGGALAGKTVFLPGFTEAELVAGDNKTHSYKVAPSLAVLLSGSVKATVDYKYTEAITTYQIVSRFINSGAHQGRVQVEGRNWFVRGFTTHDFSGGRDPQTDGSYNRGLLGAFLQAQQAVALDAPLLQPGHAPFDAARNQLIHNPTPGQGARLIIRSILNEGSGQYIYKNSFADLTVGGAYRHFLLGSDGSLFEDTKDGDRIKNYEYGASAQASKTLFDDHLKLAAAGRADRFQNFGTAFSPRASVVYSLGADKLQNFRASFSRVFLLGNVRGGFQGYALQNTAGQSFTSQLPGILAPTRNADLAGYEYNAPSLKLEEANSHEVGDGYCPRLYGHPDVRC